MYNLKGLGALPGEAIIGGGGATNPGGSTSDPCPCDCQDVEIVEKMYVSEVPVPGGIPFTLIEETQDCTDKTGGMNQPGTVKIGCDDVKQALSQMTGGPLKGLGCGCGINGLGSDASTPEVTPPPATIPTETQKAGFNYGWLGAVVLIGTGIGMYLSK